MRKLFLLTITILILNCKKTIEKSANISTGTKEIELAEIWDGTFSPETMNALDSMNGDFYSLLNTDDAGNTPKLMHFNRIVLITMKLKLF